MEETWLQRICRGPSLRAAATVGARQGGADGTVRRLPRRRRWHNDEHWCERVRAQRWIGERKVALRGEVLFWFVPVVPRGILPAGKRPPVRHRQDQRLSAAELRTFRALPER